MRPLPKSLWTIDWKRAVLIVILSVGVLGFGVASGVVIASLRSMPNLETLTPKPSASTLIYDRHGNLVATLHGAQNRIPVQLSDVPKYVQDAFVATEDERFWTHHGIDIRSAFRALFVNLRGGSMQGGSTITMQLARNSFLTLDRTWKRKIQEIFLAIQLERQYTKKEILEMYLNQIFLGVNSYGVQSASQYYFAKDVKDLNLAEAALLAGMTKSPNPLNPYVNPTGAKRQQEIVLSLMVKNKFVSQKEADEAAKYQLVFKQGKPVTAQYPAPYFIDYVLQQLLIKYGDTKVYEGGLRVYTTLDLPTQEAAERAVKNNLDPVFPLKPGTEQPEAAAVVLDPKTGGIWALVGGRTYDRQLGLNRATDSKRQPGSSIKPIVDYAPALAAGYAPSYVLDDAPVSYPMGGGKSFKPLDYEKDFLGLMTMRYAIEHSRNVPAVKMLATIGVQAGVDNAINMGITTLRTSGAYNDMNLATALGGITDGVIPLEMASAYGAFANRGILVQPTAILKVTDRKGTVLEEWKPKQKVVLTEQVAYLMTDILKGVIARGTGNGANIGRPQAGKTGTTENSRDAWFIGYTPDLVGAVWMGYDNPKKSGLLGGIYPAFIWRDTMKEALKNTAPSDFPVPQGISGPISVCKESGQLPGPNCPPGDIIQEIFLKGHEPTQICDVHVVATIDKVSGKLATEYCPPSERVTKVFIKRKEPYEPYIYTDENGQTKVLVPADAAQEVPTEVCDLHGPKPGTPGAPAPLTPISPRTPPVTPPRTP